MNGPLALIMVALMGAILVASQIVGVWLGVPQSVWLWCDLLRVCSP